MTPIPRLRITRHRRAFAAAASSAIAAAVFLSGTAALSLLPGTPPAAGPLAASGPVEVSPRLAEALDQASGGGPAGESSTGDGESGGEEGAREGGAGEDGPDGDGSATGPGDEEGRQAISGQTWFDPETGEAEIMVLFDDAGVAPEARGDQALAAASLQRGADLALQRAEPGLTALEESGAVEVLNEFWLLAGVLVKGEPTEETLNALAALPGASSITPNSEVVPLEDEPPVEEVREAETPLDGGYTDEDGNPVTYGLDQIGAPGAWAEYDARGQGVRVAVLDTGVDPNHPDLRSRLVTEDPHDPLYPGGWIHLDHRGDVQAKRPADPATHGTHVAGTVLGGDASGVGIGVAPEAELMAVNAISGGSSSAKVMKALEWSLAPYDSAGEPAGRAADVVNMSLGYDDPAFQETTLLPALERVRDAGVFPAVASGNDGDTRPGCISNPSSSYDAFAVGMTNESREVEPRSCGGTTDWPQEIADRFGWPSGQFTKPDATAPGAAVFSAVPGGGWGDSDGTSMATPHVAGAVAALRSAQAGLTVDQVEEALEQTAWHPEKEDADGDFTPDTRYGNGIIDLHAAIAAVRGDAGVGITITDDAGKPLPGVTVSWADGSADADEDRGDPGKGETWGSDEQGRVESYLPPGAYTLVFERFGYVTTTREVTVVEGGFTELEVALARQETGVVEGTVTNAETREPIPGVTVSLVGADLSATTGGDGTYRLGEVPVGEHRLRAAAEGMHTATSDAAEVLPAPDMPTTVDFTMRDLPRVLVLGDATGRSTELLGTQDIVASGEPALPADLDTLADYDVVVWDDPGEVSAPTLQRVIDVTDRAGTGVVWLDLGTSDTSGIAALHEHRKDPAERTGGADPEAVATGYRIWDTGGHPLFAAGDLHTADLIDGSTVMQDAQAGTDKFWAVFDGLRSDSAQVLARTMTQVPNGSGGRNLVEHGPGIAVDERDGNRHVFLALHGSDTAADARSWSSAGQQIFVNAAGWAAGSEKNEPPQQPPPETPDPPVDPPGDGGNRTPGPPGGGNGGGGGSGGGGSGLTGGAPVQAQNGGGSGGGADGADGGGSSQAPSEQATPKPEFEPDPPVAGENQLTSKNAGGITVRVKDGIAYVKIPDSEPGDWFFLHVYPSKTAVDWIRVNDDGELRIDVSTLSDGIYKFAFTDPEEEFVGWVEVKIGSGTAQEAETAGLTDPATALPDVEGPTGLQLSTAELLMLLGAALLLLTAAGVVLLGLRKPASSRATGVAGPTGATA